MALIDIIDRRIERGIEAVNPIVSAIEEGWRGVPWRKLLLGIPLALVMAPIFITLYTIGYVAERRDDRREGISKVKA